MLEKLSIQGDFSKDKVENERFGDLKLQKQVKPKHMLNPHPGFELVALPDGKIAKLAYEKLYPEDADDLEIELEHIAKLERQQKTRPEFQKGKIKAGLKFHYKRAVSIISPHIAAGWNRWSENILEAFLSEKVHKVVWGSGNCGKSVIFAILLYVKWRVKPNKRMVILASRVMKDASTRVFAYIKDIHLAAPSIKNHKVRLVDSGEDNKGIFTMLLNKDENRWVKNDRGCIVSVPIKVKIHKGVEGPRSEIGSNLMGKHPQDRLIIAFDEAQELPATLLAEKIFANWNTNANLDVYAWGNPTEVNFHDKNNWDMLFKLGAGDSSLHSIRTREKKANKTTAWNYRDTMVLHLSMVDSPKDDPDEQQYFTLQEDGTRLPRLHFLAGKENVKRIARRLSPNSPSWYSQVLGFPFIVTTRDSIMTVLSPHQIRAAREYPLIWKTPQNQLQWFMGVDPSITGHRDKCAITVGRLGTMTDGRNGVDLMNGKFDEIVQPVEGKDFADLTIEAMWRISQTHRIPLDHIGIETHGSGEVIRYALQKAIEEKGYWAKDAERGLSYNVISPNAAVSNRVIFKQLGKMQPAKDIVTDCATEYWVAFRCAVLNRQVFNIPDTVLRQFYSRLLEHNSNMTKYKLEQKDKFRARGEGSPDEADSLCNMFEVMRRKGFKYYYFGGFKQVDRFGAVYSAKQQQQKVMQRIGRVSELLQINANMESVLGSVRKKKKSVTWDIQTI
jgi:hypothetical protein